MNVEFLESVFLKMEASFYNPRKVKSQSARFGEIAET